VVAGAGAAPPVQVQPALLQPAGALQPAAALLQPQLGAAAAQQLFVWQHVGLQHFAANRRSSSEGRQQVCLQHFSLQQGFSQPQEGAAAVQPLLQQPALPALLQPQPGAAAAAVVQPLLPAALQPQEGPDEQQLDLQQDGLQQRFKLKLYFLQQVGFAFTGFMLSYSLQLEN